MATTSVHQVSGRSPVSVDLRQGQGRLRSPIIQGYILFSGMVWGGLVDLVDANDNMKEQGGMAWHYKG